MRVLIDNLRMKGGKVLVVLKEDNMSSDGTLVCSECGAKGYKNLIRHLKSRHQMTPKEYLSKYPEDKVYTDEVQKKFSKGGYAANQVMQDKGFDFSERSRKARQTELKNDPDAFLKRNQKLYRDPEFKQRATDRIRSATRWHGDRYQYNGVAFRSTWEVKFAEWLDSQGIVYKYEGVKVEYFDPEKSQERTYYPDFYLPDRNLCIEIKPRSSLYSVVVQAKREACIEAGYKFMFITQNELNNLSVNLLNV